MNYEILKLSKPDKYLIAHLVDENGFRSFIPLHIFIATMVLGHRLPQGACIHHVNGDYTDNINSNLVICQDAEYHSLLHMRTKEVE